MDRHVEETRLARRLTLPLVVLYGLGVTIGAGIYVLIGAAAREAGVHAPIAFVLAALVMIPTALTFAELSSRMPVAAGEAAYVREGLDSRALALLVGGLVVLMGVVSAAAISRGSAGYIRLFLPWPDPVLVPLIVLAMGAVAAYGIVESVTAAAVMTVIEISGLLIVIVASLIAQPDIVGRLPEVVTGVSAAWSGVLATSLIAFFAFVGFEGIVNVAEEVRDPRRTLPRAIFITLIVTTVLYFTVTAVAVLVMTPERLGGSEAPLADVFTHVTGWNPLAFAAIAIVATLNGIVVQIIVASRVLYGLADQGVLPAWIGTVSPWTRTPVVATALLVAVVMVLATLLPLEGLAAHTSRITLVIFALVNAALVRLKLRSGEQPAGSVRVPLVVPVIGTVVSVLFLAVDLV